MKHLAIVWPILLLMGQLFFSCNPTETSTNPDPVPVDTLSTMVYDQLYDDLLFANRLSGQGNYMAARMKFAELEQKALVANHLDIAYKCKISLAAFLSNQPDFYAALNDYLLPIIDSVERFIMPCETDLLTYYLVLGAGYAEWGQTRSAFRAFSKASNLKPIILDSLERTDQSTDSLAIDIGQKKLLISYQVLNTWGGYYLQLGQADSARFYFDQTLSMVFSEESRFLNPSQKILITVSAYDNIGLTYQLNENWEQAVRYHNLAYESLGDNGASMLARASTAYNLALCHGQLGDFERAQAYNDQSRFLTGKIDSITKKIESRDRSLSQAMIYFNQSLIYLGQNKRSEAIRAINMAFYHSSTSFPIDADLLTIPNADSLVLQQQTLLYIKHKIDLLEGDSSLQAVSAKQALYDLYRQMFIKALANDFYSESDQPEDFGDWSYSIWNGAIRNSIRASQIYPLDDDIHLASALKFSDISRSRFLLQSIWKSQIGRRYGPGILGEAFRTWTLLEAGLSHRMTQINRELFQLRQQQGAIDSSLLNDYAHILDSLGSARENLRIKIEATRPGYFSQNLKENVSLEIEELMKNYSSPDQAMLQYFWGSQGVYAFLVHQGRLKTFITPRSAELDSLLQRLVRWQRAFPGAIYEGNQLALDSVWRADSYEAYQKLLRAPLDTLRSRTEVGSISLKLMLDSTLLHLNPAAWIIKNGDNLGPLDKDDFLVSDEQIVLSSEYSAAMLVRDQKVILIQRSKIISILDYPCSRVHQEWR